MRIPMKLWAVSACVFAAAVLASGCDPTTRYQMLSMFFDGVPPPPPPEEPRPASASNAAESRQIRYREHGPYAAKMCSACHQPAAFNSLILPADQLCFQCHDFKVDKKYVHGPLASGGCIACHDPHSSQYRYLLVSESDNFCTRCHDPQALQRVAAHKGVEEQCTVCHDAHQSDHKYLLK